MITTNIANKYDKIFKKAFEILDGHVTSEDNPYWDACVAAGQMVNLDAYFISFGTLLSLVGNELGPFVLLPLDEPPFEINANTREIKVPEVFRKGVAVQGDCGSEILVFTIDRYFDYVDLNNMDIWIQYTTPNGLEKAYKVDLFDRDSIPGKIRFGWLLGPDVTNVSGALKFSVRFFKVDAENINKAEYSLSTLPQTINIYSALQPKINEKTDGYDNALFKKVVRNSLEAGAIPADSPRFDTEPAEDLPATASLVNNTLTLEALATTTDNGSIEYIWKYSSDGEEYRDVIDDEVIYDINNTNAVKRIINPKFTTLIQYYEDEDCSIPYEGDFIFEGEKTLYKKISTCTILPSEHKITGFYRAVAQNTLTATNKSNFVASLACKLPGPETLDVINGLDFETDSVILEKNNEISVTIKADKDAEVKCSWKYIPKDSEIAVEKDNQTLPVGNNGEVTFTYIPLEEGYYYAEITSLLNRTVLELEEKYQPDLETEIPQNIIRATNLPSMPGLNGEEPENNTVLTSNQEGLYEVQSYINEILTGHFTSDKQTYIWKYNVLDDTDEEKVITKEFSSFVEGPIDKPTIKIRKNAIVPMTIKCESQNILNGEKSDTTTSPTFILGV